MPLNYSGNKARISGLFLLLICIFSPAKDAFGEVRGNKSALSIYANRSYHTFIEYNDDDFVINEESGAIDHSGLLLHWQFESGAFIELSTERGKGTIDYAGYTQLFEFVEHKTEYLLTQHRMHLGRNFGSHSAYIGVGSRYRERNIVNGSLYEELEWTFAAFGMSRQFRLGQSWRLNIAGEVARALDSQQRIEFARNFDPVTIEPGRMVTGRGMVELAFLLTPKMSISFAPIYEFSRITKSDSYALKQDGKVVGATYHPKTEYETISWQLKLSKLF